MSQGRRTPLHVIEQIKSMRARGVPIRRIAEVLEISVKTVWRKGKEERLRGGRRVAPAGNKKIM